MQEGGAKAGAKAAKKHEAEAIKLEAAGDSEGAKEERTKEAKARKGANNKRKGMGASPGYIQWPRTRKPPKRPVSSGASVASVAKKGRMTTPAV